MAKRVAVTGITGLLGARLANILAERGFVVYGLIREEPSNIYLHSKINKVYGNVTSIEDTSYFIKKAKPDYIFHLAAQTQAYESITHPYETFHTNFLGSLNILEAARLYANATAIVVASTDKSYGELEGEEYLESTPLNGKFPYDASKVTTDVLARSYRHSFEMPVVSTRACNIYGPGDNNTQRLIPGIVKAFLTNKEFTIRNGGRDIREYMHVDDVVEAYLKIAEYASNENLHSAFNISSGKAYSTIEVFNLMEKAIGKEINSKIIFDEAKEISKQVMSHKLLTSATGWEPRISLEDGIKAVTAWYLNNTI